MDATSAGASPANPYPSDIDVQRLSGAITDINVTLNRYSRNFPDDVAVQVVPPVGTKSVLLMSDVVSSAPVSGINLTQDEQLETAVLEPLPTTVLYEAIRCGVNDPSDTFGLVLISAHIHVHNTSVGALASMEDNKVDPLVLRGAIKRLKWRQGLIADYCQQLKDKIEALSIPEPVLRNGKKLKSEGTEHWWN